MSRDSCLEDGAHAVRHQREAPLVHLPVAREDSSLESSVCSPIVDVQYGGNLEGAGTIAWRVRLSLGRRARFQREGEVRPKQECTIRFQRGFLHWP